MDKNVNVFTEEELFQALKEDRRENHILLLISSLIICSVAYIALMAGFML